MVHGARGSLSLGGKPRTLYEFLPLFGQYVAASLSLACKTADTTAYFSYKPALRARKQRKGVSTSCAGRDGGPCSIRRRGPASHLVGACLVSKEHVSK